MQTLHAVQCAHCRVCGCLATRAPCWPSPRLHRGRVQVVDSLKAGHQVMVFVHSRKDTGKTGRILAEFAAKAGETHLFEADATDARHGQAAKDVSK